MKSSLEITRNLVSFGFTVDFSLRVPLTPAALPLLVQAILQQVLPPEIATLSTIRDVKGVDRELIREVLKPDGTVYDQEILFVSGTVPSPDEPEEGEDTDPDVLNPVPFEIGVHSVFSEFVGSHHIDHTLRRRITPDFLSGTTLLELLQLPDLSLKSFRGGLDVFTPSRFGGLLGITPTVTETFLISATDQECQLVIRAEGLKKRTDLPLQKFEYFSRLKAVFLEILQVDLEQTYRQAGQEA